jgi:RNA polymerase sigma factor (sigma-70 family)
VTSSNSDDFLKPFIDRLLAGHPMSRAELIEAAHGRLLRLARRMLQDFPQVKRWEDTDDIFQNAALRMHSALSTLAPPTSADFLRLAATLIRRELIDLSRHYYGPQGHGTHHVSAQLPSGSLDADAAVPATDTHEPSRLAMWGEFHGYVERLPDEDRALYDLLWYQGLTQAQAATAMNVAERTIQRRWQQLRLELHDKLSYVLPSD